MKEMVFEILNDMAEVLTVAQLKRLQEVLLQRFSEQESQPEPASNEQYLEMFLDAKKVEGLSDRTIAYYRSSVIHMLYTLNTPIRKISTDQLRSYLADYQQINNCGKSTVDNIRRNIPGWKKRITY